MPLDERARQEIVAHVFETHGPRLSAFEFGDALCLALEDVSGFEIADTAELSSLISDLLPGYQALADDFLARGL